MHRMRYGHSASLEGRCPKHLNPTGARKPNSTLSFGQSWYGLSQLRLTHHSRPGATRANVLLAATTESKQPELLTCVINSDSSIGQSGTGLRFEGDRLVAVSTELCTQYRP
nr:putative integron gene cassette protein [uncultured bacterium]